MLILSRNEVEELLDLDELVDALADAMADLSADRASMPPRVAALVAEWNAMLAAMPASLPSARALTTKLVTLFPHIRDRLTHQVVTCCVDPDNGTPLALMDGTHVPATRTAACSALARRYLARDDSRVLSIIGTGVQARAHGRALERRSGIDVVRVAGREPDEVQRLVDELAEMGMPAEPATSIEEAVRSADIVCVTTQAEAPVVRPSWLRPGTHINRSDTTSPPKAKSMQKWLATRSWWSSAAGRARCAPVGGCRAPPCNRCRHRDRRPHPRRDRRDRSGDARGKVNAEDITLYKSIGEAVQDAAAARSGAGTRVDL